jgi:hypothetical protein
MAWSKHRDVLQISDVAFPLYPIIANKQKTRGFYAPFVRSLPKSSFDMLTMWCEVSGCHLEYLPTELRNSKRFNMHHHVIVASVHKVTKHEISYVIINDNNHVQHFIVFHMHVLCDILTHAGWPLILIGHILLGDIFVIKPYLIAIIIMIAEKSAKYCQPVNIPDG